LRLEKGATMATRTDPSTQPTKSPVHVRRGDVHDGQSHHSEMVSRTVNKLVRKVHETSVDSQSRERIAVAAYFLAEARHFEPGHEQEDWLQAEAQIENMSTLDS
jgi:Protein of unknown function (DUF2934)